MRSTLGVRRHEPADEFSLRRIEAHVERAVLADDGIHRPHPRDVVAPAGRATGDGHDDPAGIVQAFERAIGAGSELAVRCQRVVDVGQHEAQLAPDMLRHRRERLRRHAPTNAATRSRWPAFIDNPHLVRRHRMSSLPIAHSSLRR